MNKKELVDIVSQKKDLTKKDAEAALNAFTSVVTDTLVKGDKVPLVGFGTFDISKRAAREGRNPRTGETINVPARTAVTIKAGSKLKDALN